MGVLNLYDAVERGRPYPVRAAWFAFINFVNQCSNNNRIISGILPRLDFVVVADMFLTSTAQYADYVLPTTTAMEHADLVNGPDSYLQLQQRVIEPLYESRPDSWIVSQLARRLGFGDYYRHSEEEFIDLLLASGDPAVKGISVDRLRREGAIPVKAAERYGDKARFRTPTGRIEFYVERLREFREALPDYREPSEGRHSPLARKYPLVFVQVHSRFRTHSMFANIRRLLDLNPAPVVEISPGDAAERNIVDGDQVTVFNDRGQVTLKACINAGLHPGVINIRQGWWFHQFDSGSFNALTSDAVNPVQDRLYEPNMPMNDCLVEVRKVRT